MVLNKVKPKERQGKLSLLNASREFEKSDPKNYIPDDAIARIAEMLTAWKEGGKNSSIVLFARELEGVKRWRDKQEFKGRSRQLRPG